MREVKLLQINQNLQKIRKMNKNKHLELIHANPFKQMLQVKSR